MALSKRLQALLDRCQPGLPLWDLCCDHGLLGLEALNRGDFPEVIFNDAVSHVLEDLRRRLPGERGGRARVLHSLAENIGEPLTGNLVLAGVGGEKIFKILRTHVAHGRLRARHVIACPEKHAQWLSERDIPGFTLKERLTIPHNRGTREVLHFVSVSN